MVDPIKVMQNVMHMNMPKSILEISQGPSREGTCFSLVGALVVVGSELIEWQGV